MGSLSLSAPYPSDIPQIPSFLRVNDYVYNGLNAIAPGTQLLAPNVLRAAPFIIPHKITVDEVRVNVTTAGTAGALFICALYSNTKDTIGNDYPNNILITTGAQDGGSATLKTVAITPVILNPGIYWAVYTCNDLATEPTLRSISVNALFGLAVTNSLGTNTHQGVISVNRTYDGTMPSVFPTGAAPVANTSIPIFAMRRSA